MHPKRIVQVIFFDTMTGEHIEEYRLGKNGVSDIKLDVPAMQVEIYFGYWQVKTYHRVPVKIITADKDNEQKTKG